MTVVVLLGAPGVGKGTQATIMGERLGIPHVATGDLFRAAVRDGSPVGLEARRYMERGQLVPDDITIKMLLERLGESDADGGAILDGFPRNRAQAAALDDALTAHDKRVDAALLIHVPLDELVRRLSARMICEEAGHPYNLLSNPPETAGVCDIDGSSLIQREDDRPETIMVRLSGQLENLGAVVAHYDECGVLRTIDGQPGIEAVTAAVDAALGDLPGAGG